MKVNYKKYSSVFLITTICLCAFVPGSINAQKKAESSPQKPGIVSYSYRNSFSKDVAATLDIIKGNGITDIEFSNLFGKTAEEMRKLIDERGLYCSSFGVGYEELTGKIEEVARKAKVLGAKYVRVAGIPHKGAFTLEEAQKAIDDFNTYGKILQEQHGLTFIYHNHGFEFQPYQDGTLYDLIITKTKPEYVSFELDILWAFLPGFDPAVLLDKYKDRYKALHLKDLRKGVPSSLSGGTSGENLVVLGTGQINIPKTLDAAKKAKINHYYLEDESSDPITNVPLSIAYLKGIK